MLCNVQKNTYSRKQKICYNNRNYEKKQRQAMIIVIFIENGVVEMNPIIVTIGRQYGSGGREIGKKLAEALGIPFYDKELLTHAAQKSGFCQEVFEHHDEKPRGGFWSAFGLSNYGSDYLPMNHQLFLAQFEAIRAIAQEGSCVMIGRCADYALEENPNCISVFIHAKMEDKINRAVQSYGVDKEKVEDIIIKTDKMRASYYNFYSGRKWGDASNYQLTIDSSAMDIDSVVKLLQRFVELKGLTIEKR